TTGVTYYHIIGIGKKTVVKLEAFLLLGIRNVLPNPGKRRMRISIGQHFRQIEGDGEGTVPRLSAERTAATNIAPAQNMRVFKGAQGTEHVELAQKPDPLNCVLKFLGKNVNCPAGEQLFQDSKPIAGLRIHMGNVQNVAAHDAQGNRIDVDVNSPALSLYGTSVAGLTLAPVQEAFITFNTLNDDDASSLIRVVSTDDMGSDLRKIVYLDPQTRFDRPPEPVDGIFGQLHIDAQGNTTLQFDWNG